MGCSRTFSKQLCHRFERGMEAVIFNGIDNIQITDDRLAYNQHHDSAQATVKSTEPAIDVLNILAKYCCLKLLATLDLFDQ
jgi:hypothetical protein